MLWALAIAADRYAHIETEVIPLLDDGHHVISDRYMQSSLVLQRVDGLSLAEVWRYNAYVLPPTVTFYLENEPEVIRERLTQRTERAAARAARLVDVGWRLQRHRSLASAVAPRLPAVRVRLA